MKKGLVLKSKIEKKNEDRTNYDSDIWGNEIYNFVHYQTTVNTINRSPTYGDRVEHEIKTMACIL